MGSQVFVDSYEVNAVRATLRKGGTRSLSHVPAYSASQFNSRMRLLVGLAMGWLFVLAAVCLAAAPPNSAILDLEGRAVDPFSLPEAKAIVMVFVKTDCPISNRYAPEIRRLHTRFSPKGIAFSVVYPVSDSTPAEIRQHAADFDCPGRVLRDPSHRLVELSHARVTPEAAVFTPSGRLLYHGRIDDRYVAFGKWRPEPAHRDLEEALTAILEHRPIPAGESAVGCTIPPAE